MGKTPINQNTFLILTLQCCMFRLMHRAIIRQKAIKVDVAKYNTLSIPDNCSMHEPKHAAQYDQYKKHAVFLYLCNGMSYLK